MAIPAAQSSFSVAGAEQLEEPLSTCVKRALEGYFSQIDGHEVNDLYAMVLEEVERPMFETVMSHCRGNQVRASKLLGISRSTLRKKLAIYDLE